MPHQRTRIREAMAAILTGTTDASTRVYATQITQFWDVELPAILIYARNETSVPAGHTPKPMIRTLRLAVEIRDTASEDMDEALDDIALQVETLINANPTLNRTVQSCQLVATEIDVAYQGEKPLGAVRLTYEVIYEE